MKKLILIIFSLIGFNTYSQSQTDTAALKEIVVKAYFAEQPLLKLPASISVIGPSTFKNQSPFTLVPSLNTVPGVRMEERSPGSYRLSIRGSLLRSPFGIRNVKVYIDDFMLTDAGGNSYLNLLDAGSLSEIEVIKGPEGSIYGANTGGAVLIHPFQSSDSSFIGGALTTGSFNLLHQKFSFQKQTEKFKIGIYEGYLKSDGYRLHSSSERKYLQLTHQWNYSKAGSLKSLFFFSDLNYETPGGLTREQYEENSQAARQQSVDQNAEIFNKTLLAGISNEYKLGKGLKHVIAFTASKTDFKNPFITNYEIRDEKSAGLRTFLEYDNQAVIPIKVQVGLETQQTGSEVENFVNKAGERGSQQKGTAFTAHQNFGFIHTSASPVKNLSLELALSVNKFSYDYQTSFPKLSEEASTQFKQQLMPRVAASYQILKGIVIRSSVSRGFSSPTLEEVNPTGTAINTLLQAEKGWNKEAGIRVSLLQNRIYWDAVYFNYQLKDAIVRGVNANEADFYINAGSTKQKGFESELNAQIIPFRSSGMIRSLQLKNSTAVYHFRFENYQSGTNNFSGNKLTGVPKQTIVTSLSAIFPYNLSAFVQHNFTSALPLNDANSVFADKYNLINCKISWKEGHLKYPLTFFAGADNVLNEKYSLGNDLNAVGNRFYNPAPERNYYAGVSISY